MSRSSVKRNCNIGVSKAQIAGAHLSIYEIVYKQVDPSGKGTIPGITAAKFLKKSGLKESILHRIWSLSDYDTSGTLDKKGFFVALKLIACAQNDIPFDIDTLDDVLVKELSPPMFDTETSKPKSAEPEKEETKKKTSSTSSSRPSSTSSTAPTAAETSSSSSKRKSRKSSSSSSATAPSATAIKDIPWSISKEDKAKYDGLFKSLHPRGGPSSAVVSGDKIKPFLVNTKLDVKVLAKIWDYSDIDKDGALDSDEFAMTMHLVQMALKGGQIPAALPLELIPPSKRKAAKINGLPIKYPSMDEEAPAEDPFHGMSPLYWVVTDADKKLYDQTFKKCDEDLDGYVNGTEIKGVFLQSGLPQPVLAHIWNLADADSSGKLDHEQFALAMWLVKKTLSGVEPPKKLAPEMVPPSVRDVKLLVGYETEQAEIEADRVVFDGKMEEKNTLNESILELKEGIETKKGEVKKMENDLVVSNKALTQLDKQHKKAQETLDDLDAQLEKLTKEMEEVSERASLETQRQEREEALISARAELKDLDLEEVDLESKIRAANETIKLRQSQEDKVKEEMTNLKAVQELMKDRHKKLCNLVVQFTSIANEDELPDEIPDKIELSTIEDPVTPISDLVVNEVNEKNAQNDAKSKKMTKRTQSRDSTFDDEGAAVEGGKPERPSSFHDSPSRPSSGPSKSSLPPGRPSVGPSSPSHAPTRPSIGPPSPGPGRPSAGPPSPGVGLGPSRPSAGPPSPGGPPKRPSGGPLSGRSSPVPDWSSSSAPSRPEKLPASPSAAAAPPKPEEGDPFSCLFMPPSKNSAGNSPS